MVGNRDKPAPKRPTLSWVFRPEALEGTVAKLRHGHHVTEREPSTWTKVNKTHSQAEGRADSSKGRNRRNLFILAGCSVR